MRTMLIIIAALSVSACAGNLGGRPRGVNYDLCQYGVRAAYIHKAQHLEERRMMMQWWADYLDANRNSAITPYDFARCNGAPRKVVPRAFDAARGGAEVERHGDHAERGEPPREGVRAVEVVGDVPEHVPGQPRIRTRGAPLGGRAHGVPARQHQRPIRHTASYFRPRRSLGGFRTFAP